MSMNEKERSVIQKKFDETRQDFEKWKQKVDEDGRAKIIENLQSILSERLKVLQVDKPKSPIPPHISYYQQNFQSFKGSSTAIKLQESIKEWNNLSAGEKEPYYESMNKYHEDMIVWKETSSQDGRKKVIKAIKKLLSQLKMK